MRLVNSDRRWWSLLSLSFALVLVVAPIAGCAGADDAAVGEHAAGEAADQGEAGEGNGMVDGEAVGMEHGETGEGNAMEHGVGEAMDHEEGIDHVHPAGEDIPSRADEEERDQYSKPLEVYAFAGIGAGDTVVDVGAAGGYNTYFLADIVGASGAVYAVGGNEGLAARIAEGDMAGTTSVVIPENAAAVPDGVADAVLLVREYHLAGGYLEFLAEIDRMLKPGGVVAVVEVRIGEREGYDDTTHRNGEDTVIAQFGEGGFEFIAESDILRRDDDDYSVYGGPTGSRYVTDRMLLTFRKAR